MPIQELVHFLRVKRQRKRAICKGNKTLHVQSEFDSVRVFQKQTPVLLAAYSTRDRRIRAFA